MIKNEQQLISLMMADLERTMSNLSEKILNRWKDLIWTNWYEAHDESPYYKRTYEFFTSLVSSGLRRIPNGYEVEIYFDTNLMTLGQNGGFIQHIDREYLPEIIDEGYTVYGKTFEGAHAFEELIDELESKNYFLNEIKKEFKVDVNIKYK